MIISASYKTNVPTFYGEWFMNRLKAGYCKMVNPYSQQIYTVNLAPESIEGFVFWTKNVGPFLKHLVGVKRMGYPFIVQYTITGYLRELEYRVIDYSHTINHLALERYKNHDPTGEFLFPPKSYLPLLHLDG
jgi:Domain of unknown function (DUF1848)